MAKLIPGKVRSQGSLLYEAGKVSLQEVKEKYLYFRVEEESLRYSLDDDAVFCSCAFSVSYTHLTLPTIRLV